MANYYELSEHGTDLNDRYMDLCGECTVTATEMIDESINDFVNSDDPIHPNIRPEDVDDDTLKEIILSNIQSRLHKKFGTIVATDPVDSCPECEGTNLNTDATKCWDCSGQN
jgi:hypothetical protein